MKFQTPYYDRDGVQIYAGDLLFVPDTPLCPIHRLGNVTCQITLTEKGAFHIEFYFHDILFDTHELLATIMNPEYKPLVLHEYHY